jgi:hypothetical protein
MSPSAAHSAEYNLDYMQVGKEEPEEGSMVEVEDTDDYLLYLEDILKTVHKVGTAVPYLFYLEDSVAHPGCLSRIPDPDFYLSRIPDPKTATKERGEKKLVVIPFHVATNLTNLNIILVFKC